METLLNQVKQYLLEKYDCHTIILYGSYAVGDFTKESDLDILCISDNCSEGNDTDVIDGVQLDTWIVSSEVFDKAEEYLHIKDSRILLDKNNKANVFLEEINSIYDKGKEPISDSQKDFMKSWLQKMYNRSLKGDAEGLYRYHWMLTDSLEMYFDIKDMWYLGVKKSLRYLENNEPETFKLFNDAFKSVPGSEESRKLIEFIISE